MAAKKERDVNVKRNGDKEWDRGSGNGSRILTDHLFLLLLFVFSRSVIIFLILLTISASQSWEQRTMINDPPACESEEAMTWSSGNWRQRTRE